MKCISSEKNVQILVALLKEHNIRKVIVSPGATHMNFVATIQSDEFFEIYSELDERNAAYMACGLAYESGEPVVITCTGATASRNYLPGLTEAYHRKLPIIAVTATQDMANVGNLIPQVIERSAKPSEAVRCSVHLSHVTDELGEWECNLKVNKALLEVKRNGGGPVHINLTTRYENAIYTTLELPKVRVIRRYFSGEELPIIGNGGRIAITIGAHSPWNQEATEKIENFCELYNAVVLTDHSSAYHGKYNVHATMLATQEEYDTKLFDIDLLIHIGEHSGDYYTYAKLEKAKEVWRVSLDGEIRDTFKHLTNVFEMMEEDFFDYYNANACAKSGTSYFREFKEELEKIKQAIPELPFSNAWVAQQLAPELVPGAYVHLGVSNTMRAWTFFDFNDGVKSIANVGSRGIDGAISSIVGMSLANPERIHYCVLGDLTFFYNMNALGNRQIKNNLRIILVNNGGGAEFRIYHQQSQKLYGDEVGAYIAADGHNGGTEHSPVKGFVENLGFQYMCAKSKEEAEVCFGQLKSFTIGERPMVCEIFTTCEDESQAIYLLRHMMKNDYTPEILKPETSVSSWKPHGIEQGRKYKVVLWGTGNCFALRHKEVMEHCKITAVCDNNKASWGKEIISGIRCISPTELAEMENVFVIIMLENVAYATQVIHQLMEMGIRQFDNVNNWLKYTDYTIFE